MRKEAVPTRNQILLYLIVVLTVVTLASFVVIRSNSFRTLPLYLFLLVFGLGMMFTLGVVRGGVGGLAIIALWIGLKQTTSMWQAEYLLRNIFEILTIALAFYAAGFFRDKLSIVLDAYYGNVAKLEQFNLEDEKIGLIKANVGKLRLTEEEERSVRYKRPFSLLIVEAESLKDANKDVESIVMRTVANAVKGTTRKTDIPFLLARNQVALILPETNLKGTEKVIENVKTQVEHAYFTGDDGLKLYLESMARVTLGCSSFTGFSRDRIDMLAAAQKSLQETQSGEADPDSIVRVPVIEVVGSAEPLPAGTPAQGTQGL
ncbi:MAG TPA: hypothetical protein PKD55_03625 [Bellilinea sp.]|nr:hypothetical protein [Bellilinea sp.]